MSSGYARIKKALSSLDVAVIVKELNELIINSRIDNVFRLSDNSLLLKLVLKEGKHTHLIIEEGSRVSLTTHPGVGEVSGRIPLFRRYLREGIISGITQHMFERIVIFEIKGPENLRLIAELLPRGIVALVNSEGRVLVSTKDLSTKDRNVRPGQPYVFPPILPDVRRISREEFINLLRKEGEVGKALIKVLGVPPEIINEVLDESFRKASPSSLSEDELIRIHDLIKTFIEEVIKKPEPVIVVCDGNYVSFHPFQPRKLESTCKTSAFSLFNEAVDEFFQTLKSKVVESTEEVKERDKTSFMLSKAREDYNAMLKTREDLAELIKLIQENYEFLENIWGCVLSKVKSSGWESTVLCSITKYDKASGTYEVVLHGRTLSFSILKDFKSQYFDLVRKLRSLEDKIRRTEEVLKNLEERLRAIDSSIKEKSRRVPVSRSFQWYHTYYWIITRNGFLAIGGRDAGQNEKIVRKFMRDKDIFMHADLHGAPVFLVFTEGREVLEEDLSDVAVLAASYSKAWKEGLPAVDVFWVYGSQVSVAAPTGQYLPRGSFMVYEKKNYIKNVKLKISVGIQIRDNKYYELVSGPPELLKNRCQVLMTLEPGETKPETIANEFIELLQKTKYLVKDLRIDDVIKYIPGPSRITERIIV
ncbi:MAG: ribosome rescue protein RqcH [Desulfurococcaceae archaeon TW002]